MNRQVVLEIGNTHIKAGFIEVSSLPLKVNRYEHILKHLNYGFSH